MYHSAVRAPFRNHRISAPFGERRQKSTGVQPFFPVQHGVPDAPFCCCLDWDAFRSGSGDEDGYVPLISGQEPFGKASQAMDCWKPVERRVKSQNVEAKLPLKEADEETRPPPAGTRP